MSKLLIICLFMLISSNGNMAKNYIVISKKNVTLAVYDQEGRIISVFPIALGKNYGNKERTFDCKTPEGTFNVTQIVNSKAWKHDFGYGMVDGVYGSYFIRLHTPPFTGIGMHGTCCPKTIGTRSSEGCVSD